MARRPSDCSELDGTTFLRCAPTIGVERRGPYPLVVAIASGIGDEVAMTVGGLVLVRDGTVGVGDIDDTGDSARVVGLLGWDDRFSRVAARVVRAIGHEPGCFVRGQISQGCRTIARRR